MDENLKDRATALFGADNDMATIEKVRNSIKKSHPSIGIRYKHGVLLITQNWGSKTDLMDKDEIDYVKRLTDEAAVVHSGRSADGRKLVKDLRSYVMEDYDEYDCIDDLKYHVERLSQDIAGTSLELISRPFGAELLVGGYDGRGYPTLYDVEPDGTITSWHACAIGKNQDKIMDRLNDMYRSDLSSEEAKKVAIRCLNPDDNAEPRDFQGCLIEQDGFNELTPADFDALLEKEGDDDE